MKKIVLFILLLIFVYFNISESIYGTELNNSNVFELGQITVTADKDLDVISHRVSEIFFDEFKNLQPQNVSEILNIVEGVNINYGGKNQSFIHIRGYDQQGIKVLLDGVPMYEPYFGLVDLSMISATNISKIQIHKGSASVLNGPNSMGGVVNIISKKYTGHEKNNLSVSLGTGGLKDYKFSRGDKIGKLEYLFSLSTLRYDYIRLSSDFQSDNSNTGIDSPYREEGGRRTNSFLKNNYAGLKLGYNISDNNIIYFNANIIDAERGIPPENNRFWIFTEWKQWSASIINSRKLSDNITSKFQIYYVNHIDELEDDTTYTVIRYSSKSWFDKSRYETYSLGSNILTEINLTENQNLNIGINYIKDQNQQYEYNTKKGNGDLEYPALENKWRDAGIYNSNLYSAAVEHQINYDKNIKIKTGISYDYFKPESTDEEFAQTPDPASSNAFNPMLNINYSFSNNTNIYYGTSKKTRFPRLRELYGKHGGGNIGLKPEQSLKNEIGFQYLKDRLKFNVTVFYDNTKDLIQRFRESGEWVFANIDKVRTKGIESNMIYFFNNNDYIRINNTYLHIRNIDDGTKLLRKPEHKINLTLQKELWNDINAFYLLTYTGSQVTETENVGGYTLHNINIGKEFNHCELYLNIKNIFNTDYYDGYGPVAGRNIVCGFSTRF